MDAHRPGAASAEDIDKAPRYGFERRSLRVAMPASSDVFGRPIPPQRPVKTGLRFSRNAAAPSAWSAVE